MGIFFSTAVASGGSQKPPIPVEISYHLTLHSPAQNQIVVQGKMLSQKNTTVTLEELNPTFKPQDFRLYDDAHQKLEIPLRENGATLRLSKGRPFFFEYWVKTGPLGKHGHQGYLGKDFGLFIGSQLFLIPFLKKGTPDITVRFTLPENWNVVTSWKLQEGVFHPSKSVAPWPDPFAKEVIAFGSFETREETIGETRLVTSLSTQWSSSDRDALFHNVSKLYRYLSDLFGSSPGEIYRVVLTPLAEDGEKILAPHWAFGMGTALTPSLQRDWELLAHRFFHKFNSDRPLGMEPKYLRDHWFLEGSAAFYEEIALFESGITLDPLWKWENPRDYYSIAQCTARYLWNYFVEPQQMRIPLSEDYRVEDAGWIDFFHYSYAKLVTALLDMEIRRQTQDTKNLKDLLFYQHGHYRQEKGSFDLLRDLKAVTGHDFRPFFNASVYSTKLLPLWRLGEKYPWGTEDLPLQGIPTSYGNPVDPAALDQAVEKNSPPLPVTEEEAAGLQQLKGVPAQALKVIQRTLLQLKGPRASSY